MQSIHPLRFFHRGANPAARAVFYACLSLLLIILDARFQHLEPVRGAIALVISPLQQLAVMPGSVWQQTEDFFVAQRSLVKQNHQLQQQQIKLQAELNQLQALKNENMQLRNLLELPARLTYDAQAAEIIYSERDVFQKKVVINKGFSSELKAGQVVMDDKGIVGQITRVHPWLSEVTLITEKNHAVPVQVLRNGLRSVLFGAGNTSQMQLRYMPINADIKNGDILVSSGIDGLYPPDIPVAKVVRVERDASYPFARITCLPIGGVDRNRHVLVLSSLPKRPPYPEAGASTEPAPDPVETTDAEQP